jgi:hypothetical protein
MLYINLEYWIFRNDSVWHHGIMLVNKETTWRPINWPSIATKMEQKWSNPIVLLLTIWAHAKCLFEFMTYRIPLHTNPVSIDGKFDFHPHFSEQKEWKKLNRIVWRNSNAAFRRQDPNNMSFRRHSSLLSRSKQLGVNGESSKTIFLSQRLIGSDLLELAQSRDYEGK